MLLALDMALIDDVDLSSQLPGLNMLMYKSVIFVKNTFSFISVPSIGFSETVMYDLQNARSSAELNLKFSVMVSW